MLCIQPGAPTQNAYNERFNQITRNEWLDIHLFHSTAHVQLFAAQWLRELLQRTTKYGDRWSCTPMIAVGRLAPRKALAKKGGITRLNGLFTCLTASSEIFVTVLFILYFRV